LGNAARTKKSPAVQCGNQKRRVGEGNSDAKKKKKTKPRKKKIWGRTESSAREGRENGSISLPFKENKTGAGLISAGRWVGRRGRSVKGRGGWEGKKKKRAFWGKGTTRKPTL